MADLTITISNSIRTFGPAPSTKWGSGSPYPMTWGVSKWGDGSEDLIVSIEKVLANDLTWSETFRVGSIYSKLLENAIAFSSEMTSEGLTDGAGYSYLFPKPTLEAEERDQSTYTEAATASTTYSSLSVATTEWS